ncbi:MAG: hypothetical protein ABR987_24100 [Terracidiphilus sp.]|jgi:hypothetical protein
MKRCLTLIFLVLLCAQTAFAFRHYVGQFYDGEARPRTDVAWIWIKNDAVIVQIDGHRIRPSGGSGVPGMFMVHAVEVLPGRHVIWVSFSNGSVHSVQAQEIVIDAKSGENYALGADAKIAWVNANSHWNATIAPYTPSEKDLDKIDRTLLERSDSVEGIVQSSTVDKHVLYPWFLLAVPGSPQPRKFSWYFKMKEGQKLHVDYYPSSPDKADYVWEMQ